MTNLLLCRIVVGGLAALLAFLAGIFLSDREVPFVRHWGEVIPARAAPGETVRVVWHATFRRPCLGVIDRYLTDSIENTFTLPSSPVRYAQLEKEGEPLSTFVVPRNAKCGLAKYTADAKYICNLSHNIWPIRVNKPDIVFEIECPND